MGDAQFRVRSKELDEFRAEEFDIQDDGLARFVMNSTESEDGTLIDQIRYIPAVDIIAIDGYEEYYGAEEDKETEETEDIQMMKE
jgi:hypothetical protein